MAKKRNRKLQKNIDKERGIGRRKGGVKDKGGDSVEGKGGSRASQDPPTEFSTNEMSE